VILLPIDRFAFRAPGALQHAMLLRRPGASLGARPRVCVASFAKGLMLRRARGTVGKQSRASNMRTAEPSDFVMPGLVPGIHVLSLASQKAWMAGTSPAMTRHGIVSTQAFPS
jgi:hypothetical protein